MRNLISRAAVVALAAAAMVIPVTAASAADTPVAVPAPVTSWSPTTSAGAYGFGTLHAGGSAAQTFTLSNSGGAATSDLVITLSGSAAFTESADTCTGTSLGPGNSCTVTITYSPASPGQSDSGTLTATAEKSDATASLSLTGASASPATVNAVLYNADNLTVLLGATGTGFLPDSPITFNVTSSLTVYSDTLNSTPYVTTDASGSFNSGDYHYILQACGSGSTTITATDGTNTATTVFSNPAC